MSSIHCRGLTFLKNASIPSSCSVALMISNCLLCQRASTKLNNVVPLSHYEATVDEEWNITMTFLNEWFIITASVAESVGWITEDHIIRPSVCLDMNVSLNPTPKFGYDWCIIPPNVTITFPRQFTILPSVLLCPCKHKVIQVQTNLEEPWQVGDKRLPMLHEMVPCGMFRETMKCT